MRGNSSYALSLPGMFVLALSACSPAPGPEREDAAVR